MQPSYLFHSSGIVLLLRPIRAACSPPRRAPRQAHDGLPSAYLHSVYSNQLRPSRATPLQYTYTPSRKCQYNIRTGASPSHNMDVVAAVSGYLSRMVSVGDSSTAGTSSSKMKILLLDSETVGNMVLSTYRIRTDCDDRFRSFQRRLLNRLFSIMKSTSSIDWTTRHERRCGTYDVFALCAHRRILYNCLSTNYEPRNTESTTFSSRI